MRRRQSRLQTWRNRLATSRAAANWRSFWHETNFPMAIGLFIMCAAITYFWWKLYPQDLSNLWPEMGGMTLDVFFILIVFAVFEHRHSKRQDIVRQREVIDDYKRWDEPEAHYRIAGAIRRLNRMGVFALDLTGARLTKFDFTEHGIGKIDGSTFFDGQWGRELGVSTVRLVEVDFDRLSCQDVTFSPFNPLGGLFALSFGYAEFTDCSFTQTDLSRSRFSGASLVWTTVPIDELWEYWEEVDGTPARMQTNYGPFYQADLTQTSFKDCRFKNADFRDAENILEADFSGATGLEDAFFDTDDIRAAVLAQAAGGKPA